MSLFSIPQQNTRVTNISKKPRSSKWLNIIKLPVIKKSKPVVALMDRASDLTRGCGFESRLRQELSMTEVRPLSKAPNPHSQRWLPTAPSVCALGWVKCREHISLLVILCIQCSCCSVEEHCVRLWNSHNRHSWNIVIQEKDHVSVWIKIAIFFND